MDNEYHMDVIRSKLTRGRNATFKEVRDEIIRSLNASIPLHGDGGWQACSQKGDTLSSCGTQIGSKSPWWTQCYMWFARPRIVCLLGLRCVRENSLILSFNQYQLIGVS